MLYRSGAKRMGFQQVFRLVTRRSKPFHSRTQIWPPNQFNNTGSSIPTKFFLLSDDFRKNKIA
jgi:hypothetical protein